MPGALKVWDGSAWQTASASGSNTSVFVGPSAPAGSPRSGDLWYDTDEPSPIASVVGVTAGGTGASNAMTARSNLSVPQIGQTTSTAGAPTTGTWARGDQWLDSANVVWTCLTAGTPGTWRAPPGTELYYAENTADVVINATTGATATVVFAGAAIPYDGTPINVQFTTPGVLLPTVLNGGVYVHVWDGSTDLGAGLIYNNPAAASNYVPGTFIRKLTPTAGSHTYSIRAWLPTGAAGSASITGRPGNPANLGPATFRITRA